MVVTFYFILSLSEKDPSHSICRQRDDITLLLRNFTFQLTPASSSNTLRSLYSTYNVAAGGDSMMLGGGNNASSWNDTLTEAVSLASSDSEQAKSGQSSRIVLDDEGRVGPYVDFTSFYQAVIKAKEDGTIPQDAVY